MKVKSNLLPVDSSLQNSTTEVTLTYLNCSVCIFAKKGYSIKTFEGGPKATGMSLLFYVNYLIFSEGKGLRKILFRYLNLEFSNATRFLRKCENANLNVFYD